jgi:tetratricopeptide (TPR) repeat protein
MSRKPRARGGDPRPRRGAKPPGASAGARPPQAAAAVPAAHPAMMAAFAVAAACVLITVSFKLYETDFWHHLLVGRVIWERHAVPTIQMWSWPTYGAPEANSAWAFRALIWPFWTLGGIPGLFVWRWVTTLAVFAILCATARRMGARGFAPLVALVVCALIYRLRSQIRPETLVAVLMALELLILEARRRGGADRSPWLVPIAWIWANTHLSYYLGFFLLGVYLAEDVLSGRGERARRLAWVALGAAAISFVNPFGARALWQPFAFALHRQDIMYRTIIELKPVDWRRYVHTALPWLVGGWAALLLGRIVLRRVDRVEIVLCAAFTALSLSTQRFLGFYALVATPFLMRDLGEVVSARQAPRWAASPWTRAALTALACIAVSVPEWRRSDMPLGIDLQWTRYPVQACEFIARHGIRGRGFNNFEFGGYQAWRFWPDRERLPFMTGTIEAATAEDRYLYAGTFARPDAWRALDRRHRFDYVLLQRVQEGDNRLLDVLDADSTWALVFADDAAALYLRRSGAMAALAASLGAGALPVGHEGLATLVRAMMADSTLIGRVADRYRARVALSRWSSRDLALLANVELARGRLDEAQRLIEQGLAIDPELERAHLLLGMIALAGGRPRDAIRELERERAQSPDRLGVAVRLGQAWQRLGDTGRARTWYRRELALNPGDREVIDSLAVVERATGP